MVMTPSTQRLRNLVRRLTFELEMIYVDVFSFPLDSYQDTYTQSFMMVMRRSPLFITPTPTPFATLFTFY